MWMDRLIRLCEDSHRGWIGTATSCGVLMTVASLQKVENEQDPLAAKLHRHLCEQTPKQMQPPNVLSFIQHKFLRES